jgi:hypothetical protein
MHSTLLGPATRPPHLGSRPRPGPGLSFGLIHPRPPPFTDVHSDRVRAVGGRWRTPVNAMKQCWKACWVQALASSNLASSATSDQAIHKPRSCDRPGLARLRSLNCSLIHSTHIGIKRPKVQAHASECYRGCGHPLGGSALIRQQYFVTEGLLAEVRRMTAERCDCRDHDGLSHTIKMRQSLLPR